MINWSVKYALSLSILVIFWAFYFYLPSDYWRDYNGYLNIAASDNDNYIASFIPSIMLKNDEFGSSPEERVFFFSLFSKIIFSLYIGVAPLFSKKINSINLHFLVMFGHYVFFSMFKTGYVYVFSMLFYYFLLVNQFQIKRHLLLMVSSLFHITALPLYLSYLFSKIKRPFTYLLPVINLFLLTNLSFSLFDIKDQLGFLMIVDRFSSYYEYTDYSIAKILYISFFVVVGIVRSRYYQLSNPVIGMLFQIFILSVLIASTINLVAGIRMLNFLILLILVSEYYFGYSFRRFFYPFSFISTLAFLNIYV